MKLSSENGWLAEHVRNLAENYFQLTGKRLVKPDCDVVTSLNEAPFFVASHGSEDDPVLNYGNLCALKLFEMNWEDFVKTPSRLTAEAPNRSERQKLLEQVTSYGFIENYSGVRISSKGRRFRITNATVWNLTDEVGRKTGQAATFSEWKFL